MNLNLGEIRKWVSGVKGSVGALRQKREKLTRRIEDLETLARPRDEVADLVCARIDEIAGLHPGRFAHTLRELIHQPMNQPHPEADDEGTSSRIPVLTTTGHNGTVATAKTVERALMYLLNDQIKAGARKAIAEMPFPDAVGPPMAIRFQEIDRLKIELADVDAEIKALEAELSAALHD